MLSFEPSPLEVHQQAAKFFWDQEIFNFVADHLHLISSPSLRTYLLAAERKQAGLDWKIAVLTRCLTGTAFVVASLKADPSYDSEEDRVRAFVEQEHGCRATFFNHARKIQAPKQMPTIILTNAAPPILSEPLSLLEILRRRNGKLGSG